MSNKSSLHIHCLVALTAMTVSACGWVDSTGVQGVEVPSISISSNTNLRNAQPTAILEEQPVTAILTGEGADLQNWTWTATQTDGRNQCAAVAGFDTQLVADSLFDACTNPDECSVLIEESVTESTTQFMIRIPQLRAPVALNYQLTATDNSGSTINRQQLLCALSLNEAPAANDDQFLALRNTLRQVNITDPDNLLINDQDDQDVRNQNLRVLTTPVKAPRYAAQFALATDGSFYYQAAEDTPPGENGVIEDTFVYAVTDGSHTVEATAIIKIVDNNSAPGKIRTIPDLSLTVNDDEQPSTLSFDLSRYFFDPDNDTIRFTLDETQLPLNSNLSLSPNGVLTTSATLDDLGLWRLNVRATDGLDSNTDTFFLSISQQIHQQNTNRPPEATDIPNRRVQKRFGFSTAPFFSDPDGDKLDFSATGLPNNVQINRAGFISGTASNVNSGRWFVTVTADDGNGGTVSDSFLLVIN